MFEMYPEFIESFNKNLRITFNLRDESQKGVTVSRFARTTRATRDRNIARRLSVVSPQSDEEYGQLDTTCHPPRRLTVRRIRGENRLSAG